MPGYAPENGTPIGLMLGSLASAEIEAIEVEAIVEKVTKARNAWIGSLADGEKKFVVVELGTDTQQAEATTPSNTEALSKLDASLARAFARGDERAAKILAGPEMLSSAAIARRIGVSRQSINDWARKGKLLALSSAKRGARYPAWQLDETGQPLAGLEELASALGGGGWTLYRFLLQSHPEIGGVQGLAALRQKRLDELLGVANGIGAGNFT